MYKYIHKLKEFVFSTDGSLEKKAIRATIWVGLAGAVVSSLSFVRSIVLARLLTPEIFGLMAICMIVLRGIETFTKSGINDALIQRQNSFEKDKETAFTILVGRGVVLYIVIVIAAPYVSNFYNAEILTNMLYVVGISLVALGFYNIEIVNYQKRLDFRKLTYLENTVALVSTLSTLLLAYYLRTVWALVYGFVIGAFINTLLSYIYIRGKISFYFNKNIAFQLFGFGKYITGTSILLYLATEIDNAVIGKILDVERLGYYVLAFTLANLVVHEISRYAAKIVFPAYSELQGDLEALKMAYLKVVRIVSFVAIPSAIGICILSNEIVLVIYGEKWIQSILPLQILTVFALMRAMASTNGYVFYGVGKPQIELYIVSIRLIVLAFMVYYFTKMYGLIGASIAVSLGMGIHWLLGTMALKKIIGITSKDYIKSIGRPLTTALVMGMIVYSINYFVEGKSIQGLIAIILCGIAAYLGMNVKVIRILLR